MTLAAAACSGGGEHAVRVDTPRAGSARSLPGPKSILQLGDSVASGEGTLYGYTYDRASQEWTGGNLDATWPPPYPDCHDSPDAYGQKVAKLFGADFHQLACTGATFENGISAPEVKSGTTYRPAEFGNWATMQDLNAEYDRAKPDLVLVTLGADDVQFVPIVEACIENSYEFYFHLVSQKECVVGNPGSTVQRDFFDFLPTLKKGYTTLVSWIEARAKKNAPNDAPPKIVFTTYADPLPAKGAKCPDVSYLYPEQVQYLESLVGRMNQVIRSTILSLKKKNVGVADIQRAYQPAGIDHRWCTDDPWAYGLSIIKLSDPATLESQAPFHPTPEGQASIAEHVTPTILRLFNTSLREVRRG